mgnify:CR=1 FL=1
MNNGAAKAANGVKGSIGVVEIIISLLPVILIAAIIYVVYTIYKKTLGGKTIEQKKTEYDVLQKSILALGDTNKNPFSDELYYEQSSLNNPNLLSDVDAKNIATTIHDTFFNKTSEITNALKQCKYQVQVSQVSSVFKSTYNTDFFTYIQNLVVDNGSYVGGLTGSNYEDMSSIIDYVIALPSGAQNITSEDVAQSIRDELLSSGITPQF